MTIPDPISAIRQLLRSDAGVTAVVPAAQIYAGLMPGSEVPAQPRAAVILTYAGGLPDRGYNQLGRPRIDVRCYGPTMIEAQRVSLAVHEYLKHLVRKRASGGSPAITPTLVHDVSLEGGPSQLRDPDGDWPFVLRSYIALVAEVAA